jgi:uncharacterized membrane protein
MNKNFLIFCFSLILLNSVSGLGVSPARTTLDFEPGLSNHVNFDILNSEGKDLNLVLAVQGTLSDYISLSSNTIQMSSSEQQKTLSYDLKLPDKLEPGLHTGEVVILEIPKSGETSEAYVRATLAVVTQIHVYVPYPGKYADAKMNIINANQGEDVTFVFPIVSQGEFDLTSVKVNVDIYSKLNEKIDSFVTNSIDVPSG